MITTLEELRALYPGPSTRAIKKQLPALDRHCRRFIERSPFFVIATQGSTGADASPRGGDPGFVTIVDDETLWIPDAPGNHRLDSLSNIIETGHVGLIFFIPGMDETLRVNGRASLYADEAKLRRFASLSRPPRLVIEVKIGEAYLHCAKALMRSRLWNTEAQMDRSLMPSLGEMLRDQTGDQSFPETQEAMLARYRQDL